MHTSYLVWDACQGEKDNDEKPLEAGCGVELTNASRIAAHLKQWSITSIKACQECDSIKTFDRDYDPNGGYHVGNSPWFDLSAPRSKYFLGFLVTEIVDGYKHTRKADLGEAVGGGGVITNIRNTGREITIRGLIIGASLLGAEYGLTWLSTTLRGDYPCDDGTPGKCRRPTLRGFAACPDECEDYAATEGKPDEARANCRSFIGRNLFDCVLLNGPEVIDKFEVSGRPMLKQDSAGKRYCVQHAKATVMEVEFTIGAENPHMWGDVYKTRQGWTDITYQFLAGDQMYKCVQTPPINYEYISKNARAAQLPGAIDPEPYYVSYNVMENVYWPGAATGLLKNPCQSFIPVARTLTALSRDDGPGQVSMLEALRSEIQTRATSKDCFVDPECSMDDEFPGYKQNPFLCKPNNTTPMKTIQQAVPFEDVPKHTAASPYLVLHNPLSRDVRDVEVEFRPVYRKAVVREAVVVYHISYLPPGGRLIIDGRRQTAMLRCDGSVHNADHLVEWETTQPGIFAPELRCGGADSGTKYFVRIRGPKPWVNAGDAGGTDKFEKIANLYFARKEL